VIFNEVTGKNVSSLDFRVELVRQMLEKHKANRKPSSRGRPRKYEPPTRLTERHFPTQIPPTEKKKYPARVCRICPGRNETRWECVLCGNVPLHNKKCFEKYHKETVKTVEKMCP
jgi:hypothetical protein